MALAKTDLFRNQRLALRLSIGFGVVLLLVAIACAFAGQGLLQIQQHAQARAATPAVPPEAALLALDQVRREAADDARIAQDSLIALLALCGLACACGAFSAWRVSSSVAAPLEEAIATAHRIAEGDLQAVALTRRGDETGRLLQALDGMRTHLASIVAEVRRSAEGVAGASGEIAQGHQHLSQRTEMQASTLEETASAMEELTATVQQNADNARLASQLAVAASGVARQGGEVVGEVVNTMSGISESSRRIEDIIGVIDGIAFQTNILALNAAVEAARAGEQGRGFAVVAAEVRNLAQRSAAAAKEIKTLIGESAHKVETGGKLVDAAGRTMQEIVDSVKKVSDLVAEIAAASQEQSSGIAQVNTAVGQMEQVVQQNASLVEEATAATAAMDQQAGGLLRLVARFRVADGRATPSTNPYAAAAPAPIRTTSKLSLPLAAVPLPKATVHVHV
jgi:methyl-accepting chemotaxis protein